MAKAKYTFNPERKTWHTLVWDGTYTKTGAKHRVRITSRKSSADLERMVHEYNKKVEEGNSIDFSDQTFIEYANFWLDNSKDASELNTKTMYRNAIKHFNILGKVKVSDIKRSHYVMIVKDNNDHPRECQIISMTFKQIIKAAVSDHILPRNALEDIFTGVSLPKIKKSEKQPLTPLEKQAYFEAELDSKKRCFVDLLYYCGLRRQEVLALTRFDFDFEKGNVSINKVIVFDSGGRPQLKSYPKSDRGLRKVPIPQKAIPGIKKYVDSQEGYIFHNLNSAMMSQSGYNRMWSSIITSFNIALGYNPQAKGLDRGEKKITNLTAHRFRHNYCTELCYQIPKISTKKIAQLLGDTEKMVIEVYSHIVDEKENVSEVIENVF